MNNFGDRIEVSGGCLRRSRDSGFRSNRYVGCNFQDFEVYELLGKGGFASVYRAKCLRTGILVAIKMVSYFPRLFRSGSHPNNICATVQAQGMLGPE